MNEPNYGARIRAVCNYLETVPGEKYSYAEPYLYCGRGCVVAHGLDAGIIPDSLSYTQAKEWLGLPGTKLPMVLYDDAIGSGETGKKAAITALRAYAAKHYPITNKREGIPQSVREIFQPKREAA